ncbi:MAG: Ldh family oxidoreductase [Pseudomonadota bacterium]
MTETVRLSLDEVHRLAMAAFTNNGTSEPQARAVADTVTAAERDECTSHGLFRIPGYLAAVKSGKVNPKASPEVTQLAPAVIKVDADGGFAPLALERGRAPLVELAKAQGIAAQAIVNSYHFAALWPEVEALADEGLVGFAYVAAMKYVAPAGGTKPLYGTNPMAFAWPRPGRSPLAFDQASSASARGEIMLHQRDGHALPDGWAIDAQGQATNDPSAALAGAQLAFGGYKGASIALMVELMAGALVGDLFSFEASEADNGDGGPPRGGEFLIAIDPARCVSDRGRDAQLAHAEGLFTEILAQPGTRLPSDRRYEARQRTPTDGVTVPRALHDTIVELGGG